MSDDGTMLGRLRNITTNERTGDLTEVLVEPADDVDARLFKRDARGYVVFPFENVKSVRDVIVGQEPAIARRLRISAMARYAG